MTTSLPTIYPVGYAGTTQDFLETKVDRSGAVRLVGVPALAIPNTTASATLIGLMPFNAGFKVTDLKVWTDELDSGSSVTLSVGYTYYDSTTGTSVSNAFASAVTTAQGGSGARITMTGSTVLDWTAAANGWLTITTGGGATTVSGNILANIGFAYDQSGVTNLGTP